MKRRPATARFATAVWFCVGAAAAVLLLELALRALPVYGGVYAADPQEQWPGPHLVSNLEFTYSFGWNLINVRHGHINNFGYAAPFNYVPRTSGVMIMGDSYIESLMNSYADTLQGSLDDYLDSPQPVLNFGVGGASLADYVGLGPLVREHFEPTWAVLVITNHDFIEGFKRQRGYFHWAPDGDFAVRLLPREPLDPMSRFIRELALVRYARANLKLSLGHLVQFSPAAEASPCRSAALSDADRALIGAFVRNLPASFGLPASQVILVFDSDREAIYGGRSGRIGAGCVPRDEAARLLILQQAVEHGLQVVRTAPLFERFYKQTGKHVDYLPTDGHWNANAHRLVAQRVANIINAAGAPAFTGAQTAVASTQADRGAK